MSLHPQPIPAIPQETARVAHAVLPQGSVYMQMRDALGTLYQDQDFLDLFPTHGQPAQEPWRLALVTVMQYAEGLTDRQAADAVRTRIDWKYALSLELTDGGFDFSVLSEFRSRLLANGAERRLFDLLLKHFRERGWIKAGGKQRTDSTHVLAAIRTLRRLECVGETMRHAQSAPGRSRSRLAARADGSGVGRALSQTLQRFSSSQRSDGAGEPG
jgi:transposase